MDFNFWYSIHFDDHRDPHDSVVLFGAIEKGVKRSKPTLSNITSKS